MSIRVITKLVVGVKFSHLCRVPENPDLPVVCVTPALSTKLRNSFQDGIINNPEVNPQLISLLLDLDYFLTPDGDAYIGEEVGKIDVGTQSVDTKSMWIFEKTRRSVCENLNVVDFVKDHGDEEVKIAMIGSIETDEQEDEEEDED